MGCKKAVEQQAIYPSLTVLIFGINRPPGKSIK